MKCPKCKTTNPAKATECDSCGVIFADIRTGKTEIDRTCAWNDHGIKCQNLGCCGDSTNGSPPFYCSTHFLQLKGWPATAATEQRHITYRERWYAERGLTYEPP